MLEIMALPNCLLFVTLRLVFFISLNHCTAKHLYQHVRLIIRYFPQSLLPSISPISVQLPEHIFIVIFPRTSTVWSQCIYVVLLSILSNISSLLTFLYMVFLAYFYKVFCYFESLNLWGDCLLFTTMLKDRYYITANLDSVLWTNSIHFCLYNSQHFQMGVMRKTLCHMILQCACSQPKYLLKILLQDLEHWVITMTKKRNYFHDEVDYPINRCLLIIVTAHALFLSNICKSKFEWYFFQSIMLPTKY